MSEPMKLDAAKLAGWEFEVIESNPWLRLYWKGKEDFNGFEFVSFQVTSCGSDDVEDPYAGRYTEVEILWHGSAMFDGVRHLYLGHEKSDNYGYVNYPKKRLLIEILQALFDLEQRYCQPTECEG